MRHANRVLTNPQDFWRITLVDFCFQCRGEHPPGPLTDDLVDQGTGLGRAILGDYAEHGRTFPTRAPTRAYSVTITGSFGNAAMGWLKNNGRTSQRPVSMTAPTRSADMTFDDIVRETRDLLPGTRLRRRLFWRYPIVWDQP
jgi:hypothetical protein